jgi:16S rRNA (guanine527-N7)-methyltransferase
VRRLEFRDFLVDGLKAFGMEIGNDSVARFEKYKELLVSWNENVNLTAITDDKGVAIKHFIDSISMMERLRPYMAENASVIDVGTGAGFPGIPFKIMREDLQVTLLDSLNKRIKFLEEVCSELKLDGISSTHFRAEDGAHDKSLREKFDVSTARAVAPLNVLMEYCIPFTKVGGYFIALKSKDADDEIKSAKKAFSELSCELQEVIRFSIDYDGESLERAIIVIKKTATTKPKYPRKAGTPSKKPL